MKLIESVKEFGGYLNRYTHDSVACQSEMTFSAYLPPQAAHGNVPALYWLSGLTCTDDNFRVKAGAQRYAAEHGIALIIPDTSPRGDSVPDVPEHYDLGQGAGFYVNAIQPPWDKHFRMYDYVVEELPHLVEANLPLIPGLKSISGHSMGGHGALIAALKNPIAYRSVSAFAPICHPLNGAWGKGCFAAYLGETTALWEAYDATCLVQAGARVPEILIDQGTADEFLMEGQLLPEVFQVACLQAEQTLSLRMQEGYDHSYHFIATFIGEHMAWHAQALR
ncbi:S-formylglutathione hydrolase [Thiothrix fructosivorans]|uniref:S-formylglutathione hydrolase n=1 Tax=Thiothrix fructosivorans TaxID=111770 RepID=A0A8B0SHV7_9GAMM|nr:S-formylglutathione hydrolase [Thiothrix fructosivorans]MBO0614856.1 S-formylglutathione hydrolase [Thiothrix fructosivorans]QTX09668.1 S-formylglutathione hydrolase [Thiothrix fructosivorans]